jgi:hypothetical protein
MRQELKAGQRWRYTDYNGRNYIIEVESCLSKGLIVQQIAGVMTGTFSLTHINTPGIHVGDVNCWWQWDYLEGQDRS